MGPGREGRRLLLEGKDGSSGVGSRRAALLSRLAWEISTWQLSPGAEGVLLLCCHPALQEK